MIVGGALLNLDTCISVIPNCPPHKHGEGGFGLSVWRAGVTSACPPSVDGVHQVPRRGVQLEDVKFFNDQGPQP
ncbi:unnamed protein product [Triticum turgidum subsp. durum]|uniref:Uncharacterized protein n=1 Tax=Triticum turgidum subsp. durum TaxID=4567 RepID=A0A9R1A6I3_TRITD|nr:unnamed protein product [Triticum turgidum subsp. durum]